MPHDRRQFLVRTGLTFAAGALADAAQLEDAAASSGLADWEAVRGQFRLSRAYTHLATFLLASHPAPVRAAIERHRRGLDVNPVHYLRRGPQLEAVVLREAAAYLGADVADIALTDSTTMGLGLLYHGIALRTGQEIVTTTHDHYATSASVRLAAQRAGASVRTVTLYTDPAAASERDLVDALMKAVTPRTRLVAVTWVHSGTGVKLPIRQIADALRAANAGREPADRALLCVDGVHGLGVEDVTMAELGCDFFVAGCHKWLFGPRGTGVVWGSPRAWTAVRPVIPSFSGSPTPGAEMTPGGFHSFEHRWALAEAFRFHRRVGKPRVEARIHALNSRFKDGLAAMSHVTLRTPRSPDLSAGLVCFDVRGSSPTEVVQRLAEQRIIATVTPYATSHARVAPSILNTADEIDRTLRVLRATA